jgi:hypothetical protein
MDKTLPVNPGNPSLIDVVVSQAHGCQLCEFHCLLAQPLDGGLGVLLQEHLTVLNLISCNSMYFEMA